MRIQQFIRHMVYGKCKKQHDFRFILIFDFRYTYGWSIPICGTKPSYTNFPTKGSDGQDFSTTMTFGLSTIWQWQTQPVSHTHQYYLGLYNATSWSYGYYQGNFAIGFKNINGQSSSGCVPSGAARVSSVYLQCNPEYNVSYPYILSKEVSTCVCK